MRKVKIDIDWQVIDAGADHFIEFQRVIVIDVLDQYKSPPLVFALLFYEAEFTDWMAIEGSLVSFNHRVVSIDPHRPVIIRDRKGENLPVQLFLALHRSIKLYDPLNGNGHAVRVLPVGNVESCGAALDLVGEEGKVHPRCSHEIGKNLGPGFTHERFELIQLFLGERRSPESYRVVRLWTSALESYGAIPALVDTFVEMFEMFSTLDS